MEYNKPQIVKVDDAVRAIQSHTQKEGVQADAAHQPTGCAYEADE